MEEIKFEKVNRFANRDIAYPVRKTANAAGYDFVVAEDIIIPSYEMQMEQLRKFVNQSELYSIDRLSKITKEHKLKPTLVSTGMKCKLDPNTYLELSVRSSSPLKYWLVLANGVGIIDADYYNNPDNEGEIFFQFINLYPVAIDLAKGDTIGQGIIKPYLKTSDDSACGERLGGFGSTSV